MPGEQGRQGWANTALFSSLVADFGWFQRGPIDQNINCQKCQPYANGNPRQHGVDAIFTFDCPYSLKTRGVIVDGKRYTLDSVGGSAKIRQWLDDSIKTALHARDSLSALTEERNLPPDTQIDTVIVAWDCHKDWNAEKGKNWIKQISLGQTPSPLLSVFLSDKSHLDRLQTLSQFRKTVEKIEFLYSLERRPVWSEVLTPELFHSSILPVRYKKYGETIFNTGIIYFDIEQPSEIRFLVKYLDYSGLLTHNNINIHIPCSLSDLESFKQYFFTEFKEKKYGQSISTSSFEFSHLAKASFAS